MNYQKLFDYMKNEHGVTLLETDMIEIERIVKEQTKDEMYSNMQGYLEYCNMVRYVAPKDWIETYKHF